MAHVVVLSGEPDMTSLSPSSSVAVPYDPVAAGVSDSGDSMILHVHAAPVGVDATSVGRKLTVKSHSRGDWSTSKSRGETIVSIHSTHAGDSEWKSIGVSGIAAPSIPVGERKVLRGGEMSGPPDGLQSFVVESSPSYSGS